MKDKHGEEYPDTPSDSSQFAGASVPWVQSMMHRVGGYEAVVARTNPLNERTALFFIERQSETGIVVFERGGLDLTVRPKHALTRWNPVAFDILIRVTKEEYERLYPEARRLIVAPNDSDVYRRQRGEI